MDSHRKVSGVRVAESRVIYKTLGDPITHVMRKQAVTIVRCSLRDRG